MYVYQHVRDRGLIAILTTNYSDTFQVQNDSFPDASDIPIPGAPLLNQNEQDFLGQFFNPMNFGTDLDFASTFTQLHDHNQNADFTWLIDEPPPTLISAATPKVTSPHAPPALVHAADFGYHSLTAGGDLILNGEHTDILSGNSTVASMLDNHIQSQQQLQTLHVSPPSLLSRSPSQRPRSSCAPRPEMTANFMAPPPPMSTTALAPPTSSFNFQAPVHLKHLDTTVSHTADFHFDGPHSAPPGQGPRLRDGDFNARLYRFGTDDHFGNTGFQGQEQGRALEKKLLQDLWILGNGSKAENTAIGTASPSTPEQQGPILNGSRKRIYEEDETRSCSPADLKKFKTDPLDSGDESGDLAVRRPTTQPRTSTAPAKLRRLNTGSSSGSPDGSKRRRNSSSNPTGLAPTSNGNGAAGSASLGGANKPIRENLSEEQKRSNHIMSEQKRRNLIKAGFDDLHILVPELKQGGLSKSNVLVESANFLEQVIRANIELKRRLGRA